jgi:electron transfer flavoprotein alpha subunit
VYTDLRSGAPTRPSLFAISEARRIARGAGATVYAVVPSAPLSNRELAALATPIAAAGADKLLLCEAPEFAEPPADENHGRALDAAIARVAPMLIIFPAGGVGAVLAAPLAARLGGPYVPWADFMISDADAETLRSRSRVQVLRVRPGGRSRRRLDPAQIERPIVATVCSGLYTAPASTEAPRNLEVDVLPVPPRADREVRIIEHQANPLASIQEASIIVLLADPDAHPGFRELLETKLPAGAIVARAATIPAAVLASCCPEVLIKVGGCDQMTARSPRTRVILAVQSESGSESNVAPSEDVDIVWLLSSPSEIRDLVAAL